MFGVFNILLVILWLRLLPQRDTQVFFNPYVLGVVNLVERWGRFFRQALPFLSVYAMAWVMFLFVLIFRGIVSAGQPKPHWFEMVGFWTVYARVGQPPSGILFSVLSFGLLLHQIWTLDWVMTLAGRKRKRNRAGELLSALSMPIAMISPIPRGVLLLVFGGGLATAMFRIGIPTSILQQFASYLSNDQSVAMVNDIAETRLVTPVLFWIFGAMTMMNVLTFAGNILLFFIVMSLVGLLFRLPMAMTLGKESVDQLVGIVFRRRAARAGAFDFTPILFFFVLAAAQGVGGYVLLLLLNFAI